MKNIIVIFGGKSPEHDVSIITGCLALNCLDKEKFNPIPVYVDKEGKWFTGDCLKKLGFFKNYTERSLKPVTLLVGENTLYTNKGKKPLYIIAGAINCLHGGKGENGIIGGLFDLCNIPCTSTGVYSSQIAMDKSFTKKAMKAINVETVPYLLLRRDAYYGDRDKFILQVEKSLNYPVIVKPCNTGSSIGINISNNQTELDKSLVFAFRYDSKVIVEKYIDNFVEINCACYKKNSKVFVSQCEKPTTRNKFLTFKDKYLGCKAQLCQREFPANISEKLSDKIKDITKQIYLQYEFSGIVRMDFLIEGETVYLNEINAIPGSMAYYLFYNKTQGLTDLLTDLLEESFKINLSKNCNITEFSSEVLSFKGVSLKK